MAGTVAVREFTSVAEMQAHYAAVQRKCFDTTRPGARKDDAPGRVEKAEPIEADEPEAIKIAALPIVSNEQRLGKAVMNGADAVRLVSEITGYSKAQLSGPIRKKNLARARMIAYWLLVRYAGKSTPRAGEFLGGRDHSTVIAGVNRIERVLAAVEGPIPETAEGVAQLLWVVSWPHYQTPKSKTPLIRRPTCAKCGAAFEAGK